MKIIAALVLIISLDICAADPDVFQLTTGNGKKEYTATAFYVSETQLLTAAHTFKYGLVNTRIEKAGRFIPVRVLKIDFKADIALLECSDKGSPLPIATGGVRIYGFPGNDNKLRQTDGIMTQIEASAHCYKGMSGGPLVTGGVVVGMGVARDGDRYPCFAVPADALLKFMQSK